MKAIAVFPKEHKIEIIDHHEPHLSSPNDVKLKMLDVGICGTDKEICAFQYGTPPDGSPYLVLGHESLGIVTEIGVGVKRVKVGNLVVTMVRRPCQHPECLACRADRQDFCYTGDFKERGIKQQHGYMTEYVVDDEKYMNVVPKELREIGVLTEPLTIAEKALEQILQVQQRLPWAIPVQAGTKQTFRHKAVVLGAGPVGLLGAMVLVANNFDTHVYSRELKTDPKANLVQSFGAKYISCSDIPVENLSKSIGNIDLVYEATGASVISFKMIEQLGTNAVFVFTGVPGRKAPIQVDTDLIMRNLVLKNQVVFGTVNAGRIAYEAAIKDLGIFMKQWPDAIKSMITRRFPVGSFKDPLLGKSGGIKNVISFET